MLRNDYLWMMRRLPFATVRSSSRIGPGGVHMSIHAVVVAALSLVGFDQSYFARQKLHDAAEPVALPAGDWSTGSWSSWSNTCSSSAKRTRSVTCEYQGSEVEASRCVSVKPVDSETGFYDGCANMIVNGTFASGLSSWSASNADTANRYSSTGVSARIFSGGRISQTSRPLTAGRTYVLSAACESATGNSNNSCNVTGQIIQNGRTIGWTQSGSADLPAGVDRYAVVVGDGNPVTVRFSASSPAYVDNVTLAKQ